MKTDSVKCTYCGSTHLQRKDYHTEWQLEAGGFSLQGVNTYVCQECGHIEFFDSSLDAYAEHQRAVAEEEKRQTLMDLDAKICEKKGRLLELAAIIVDLDSTQRQVQAAKVEQAKTNSEIQALEAQKSRLR